MGNLLVVLNRDGEERYRCNRPFAVLEPLFYRGRGITASDAVFTIIWRGFSA